MIVYKKSRLWPQHNVYMAVVAQTFTFALIHNLTIKVVSSQTELFVIQELLKFWYNALLSCYDPALQYRDCNIPTIVRFYTNLRHKNDEITLVWCCGMSFLAGQDIVVEVVIVSHIGATLFSTVSALNGGKWNKT